MYDRGGHPVSLQQICPDHGMRALDLVVDGLADVVEQARQLGDANIGANLRRHHGGEIGDFFGMVQHLLSVAGTEAQDAEVTDDFRVKSLESDLQNRRLALLFDPLQDLQSGLGDDLFDPSRMNPAVHDQLVQRDSGDLTSYRVETADDDGFRGVVDD